MEFISPNYTFEKLENPSFNDLIDIFEDRITHWIIEPSETLLKQRHGHFAAIGILLTYFEPIQSYIKGEDSTFKSKEFFIGGFESVFVGTDGEQVKKLASTIYTEARCGFFHEGLTREKILFATAREEALLITLPKINGELDLQGEVQSAIINPKRFQWCVERHFSDYIQKIRNPINNELRTNFRKIVEMKWGINNEGPMVGISKKELFNS